MVQKQQQKLCIQQDDIIYEPSLHEYSSFSLVPGLNSDKESQINKTFFLKKRNK